MCFLAYSGFLRYSELCQIKAKNITFGDDHIDIYIESSKTDCYRKGKNVLIAKLDQAHCPVKILSDYLDKAKIDRSSDDFVFRALSYCKSTNNLIYYMGNNQSGCTGKQGKDRGEGKVFIVRCKRSRGRSVARVRLQSWRRGTFDDSDHDADYTPCTDQRSPEFAHSSQMVLSNRLADRQYTERGDLVEKLLVDITTKYSLAFTGSSSPPKRRKYTKDPVKKSCSDAGLSDVGPDHNVSRFPIFQRYSNY
ncbi:unnamed protein product [Mytilus coruscus]|uniref:Tyr recombinase domain-containing protein n=1 Tax=Mytilus coruscus TaxID=42192 RepID=A0A6J8B178_MYTCO|nr:unnamed protein product [Mytilus coruscus]